MLTQAIKQKPKVNQHVLERKLLGVILNDRLIKRIVSLKWKWMENWCSKIIRLRPWGERRSVNRPQMRWGDDLKTV